MSVLISIFLFSIVLAFAVAKLEIQIEGKDGWAKNLPTWRIKNRLTKFFYGEQPLTGYHFWLVVVLLIALHSGFFAGLPWSLSLELKIMGCFWLAVVIEDFLWFALNPYYGVKKFNRTEAHWHTLWILGLPALYWIYGIFATFLIGFRLAI